MKSIDPTNQHVSSRVICLLAMLAFALGFLVLMERLRELQVMDSSKYGYASSRQSERRVQTESVRGRILDRKGRILAENRPTLSIVCQPSFFQRPTWDETVREIARAIEGVAGVIYRPSTLSEASIRRHVMQSLAIPLTVWREITEDEALVFSEYANEWPGFELTETTERVYPYGSLAAHVIGYVGRDRGESQAGDVKFNYYNLEMRGRSGLEIYYDSFLKGVPGEQKVVVDARGFAMEERTVLESRPGLDLKLSLDVDIQSAVETELKNVKGACVVMNPRSGEVLALASSPAFDLNDFVPSLSSEVYQRYARDPEKPLLNRASGGMYAPGSIFKPVVALAGLSLGVPADATYECIGVYRLGSLALRCTSLWGHGELDMPSAIMKSCNPYFCNLASDIGTNALFTAARHFGLGARTGIDFGVDAAGVIPDAEWKMRRYHEPWYPGDLAQLGIGQGMLLVSPLQMVRIAGAIGTGWLVRPHLKLDIPVERERLPYSDEQLRIVREGMYRVVNGYHAERGSGRLAGKGLPVAICGKTGTAEIGVGKNRRKNTWFIAYAPAKDPTVAIALVVENGESGGTTAAPRVNAILKRIFCP